MEPNKDLLPGQEGPAQKQDPPTPLYVRVLALVGALAVIGLSIAYTYSVATGGIFWF